MAFLRDACLILAILTTGTVTGVYLLYQHTIMPGLRKTDDRTFVAAFQAIDRAIINPFFMFTFLGPTVFSLVATAVDFGPWLLAATVLNLAVVVITLRVNVPLNNNLKANGDRTRFNEALWVRWNLVRCIASSAAFVSLCVPSIA